MKMKIFNLISLIILFSQNAAEASDKNKMTVIPSGIYTPLYVTDSVEAEIEVDSFLLDIYPVTNSEFLTFVKQNPKWRKENVIPLFADKGYLKHWESDTLLGGEVNPNAPVTNISWFAAKAFAEYYEKRLPTAAEWELAAKADDRSPDGTDNPDFTNLILKWYSMPSSRELPDVGSIYCNYFGVYDIHGLVWEWTADYFNSLVSGESRGDNGINRNLFCGSGSVGASDFTDYPAFIRFAFRSSLKGNYTTSNLGFRCAKDINKNMR